MGFFDVFKSNERKRLDVPLPPSSLSSKKLPKLPEFPAVEDEIQVFEKKELKVQEKELKERDTLKLDEPFFVEVDLYRAMIDELNQTNLILKENDAICNRLEDFKNDFDKEYNKFQNKLGDIQRKLIFADKRLFRQ